HIDTPLDNAVLNGRMVEQPVTIAGSASIDPFGSGTRISVKVQLNSLPPQFVESAAPDFLWSTRAAVPPIVGQLSISASFTYGGSATTPPNTAIRTIHVTIQDTVAPDVPTVSVSVPSNDDGACILTVEANMT